MRPFEAEGDFAAGVLMERSVRQMTLRGAEPQS
jgi:hypothetical protein